MANVSLAGVDLNLLVALDALLSERSVTRAAQRMGLSQPAMSNALARLRDLLEDPVLVRTGHGMEPTARALDLAAPVHRLLMDARQVLAQTQAFDPATTRHRFRIESTADFELSLLPDLAPRVATIAPNVELLVTRASRDTEEELRTGRIDLFVGLWSKIPSHLHSYLLRHDGFACIARRGHPRTRRRLTLRAFGELAHVVVTPDAWPGGIADTVHADRGLGQHVLVRTPDYLVAAKIVARSNAIATLPRGIAHALAELLPLDVFRAPLDVADVSISMVWHPRTHQQDGHRWLRSLIMDACAASEW
ncbi:LysR family transcriptional regulator [Pendulispora rubella]|uniref:LysR family transcriptional regulator n=1 Tax=Pendulispora rubella TaxID=2741070 RepID=A0ABZ2KPL0_9BACT